LFSFPMSNSHLRCPLNVQLDIAVRRVKTTADVSAPSLGPKV